MRKKDRAMRTLRKQIRTLLKNFDPEPRMHQIITDSIQTGLINPDDVSPESYTIARAIFAKALGEAVLQYTPKTEHGKKHVETLKAIS